MSSNRVAIRTIKSPSHLSFQGPSPCPHYVKYHFQRWLQCICRGGLPSRPYARVSTNHAFVGAVPRPPLQIDLQRRLVLSAAPTNRFVRAASNTSRPYKIDLQGRLVLQLPLQIDLSDGYSTNRPYSAFSAKKKIKLPTRAPPNQIRTDRAHYIFKIQ